LAWGKPAPHISTYENPHAKKIVVYFEILRFSQPGSTQVAVRASNYVWFFGFGITGSLTTEETQVPSSQSKKVVGLKCSIQ
jgi:hypothetical protein